MSDELRGNEAALFEALETVSVRRLMRASVPPRFFVATVTLVILASLLLHPSLEVRQATPSAVPKARLAEAIPRELPRCPPGRLLLRSTRGKAPLVRIPPIEIVYEPDRVVSDTLVHTTRRGESMTSIAHRYLSQTLFMTADELETAIRKVNGGACEKRLSPGEQVVVPGYETAAVVEQPIPMAKDDEVRAIYLTGAMAGSKHGIYLIRRWKELGGNAIVFDVKDSDGSVSIPFNHELAPKFRPHVDNPPKFARFLHSLGLHSIARIALFRDELLVKHHPELAVQSRRTRQAWRENGKPVWTDPSRPEVQDYNIALARLAATSGVDEIQFDYVRFPAEGDQKDAQFFFQAAHPDWKRSKIISDFLARAYAELHPLGVLVSLDVFGVMAWQRPVDLAHTGQDIVAMVRSCDVLSPMIYPSHFFGMDGYARPGDAPEHFIGESMERFQEITADSGVVLRPWLQAFAWRTKTYSPQYILRQVATAKEEDGIGYLFWNARNDYSKPFVAMTEIKSLPRQHSSRDQLQVTEKSSPSSNQEPITPSQSATTLTDPTGPEK